jgi:hypothetical protein
MTGDDASLEVQGETSNFSLDGINERIIVSTSCDGVQVPEESDTSSCMANDSLMVVIPEPVSCTSLSERITCGSSGVASFHDTNRASWTLTFVLVFAFAVTTGL